MDYEETRGAPCWIELYTADPGRALPFYEELFGWSWESSGEEFGGYVNISADGKGIAGCMRNDGSTGAPDAWVLYLATPDVAETSRDAVANGAQELVAPMDIMDLGKMAFFNDPGGAQVGAWQAGSHKGFEVKGRIGAPYYFELHTRSYASSVDFYRKAFGWDARETSDTEEFRYTTLGSDPPIAGIMDATAFLPPEVPAAWYVYFEVADVDAALEKVPALGGSVVLPADDSPYGRLAHIADPTGAELKVIQTNS